MSGKRQPTATVVAKGKKHMTKAEQAQREALEPKPSKEVKSLSAPKWLPAAQKTQFAKISKALVDLMGPVMIHLDAETIAQYCIVQAQWLVATNRLARLMVDREPDQKELRAWGGLQSKLFAQAHTLAADMGLTITARCQLVIPQQDGGEDENNAFADYTGPCLVPDTEVTVANA